MISPEDDPKWEDKVAFMRADLESNMRYTRIIEVARKQIEASGKNFLAEFEKWRGAQ